MEGKIIDQTVKKKVFGFKTFDVLIAQRVGRVTLKELKRRGITGETLRREIWDPKTPSTQSPNAR